MRLIFIYNADSGMLNTMKDIGQKLFSPATYDCFLCSLTHGTFRENPEWKRFREASSAELVFLHRDEFEKQYGTSFDYPVIVKENEGLEVAVNREELSRITTLAELMARVRELETGE